MYAQRSFPHVSAPLGRAGWAALAAAACAMLALGIGRAWSEGDAARATAVSPSSYEAITVEPGDTLWDIAARRYPNSDVRARVFEIERANGLSGPVIMEGQRLEVPRR